MKMGKKNKWMLGIVVGVVAISGVLLAVNKSVGQKEVLPQVEVAAVTKGDVAQVLDATGTVESQKKKTFFSPVNGKISHMEVQAGDPVKKGQKLITFNLEDLEKENQKAELNQLSGQYDMQNTVKRSNEAASKQANAKANAKTLESQVASWKQYVSELRDQINLVNAEARAEVSQQAADAREALKRQQEQLQKGYEKELQKYQQETLPAYQKKLKEALAKKNDTLTAYNKADMEYMLAFQSWSDDQTEEKQWIVNEKEAARSEAQVSMEMAEEAYTRLEKNPPVQPEMPSSLEEGAADLGGTYADSSQNGTADTSALQAELEDASAVLADLQSELASEKAVASADAGTLSAEERAKMEVTNNLSELESKSLEELIEEGRKGVEAEFNGVISEASVTEGAAVTQGLQLFTLQSTEDVCVDINISKYDFDKIGEGQKADITIGSHVYQGTVSKVSRIAQKNEKGTSMIQAQVHIDNPDANIFLGVDAKVKVHAKEAKGVLVVPTSVVNIGKEGSFCYVVEDGIITKKNVTTGLSADENTEILDGLEENDAVILDMGNYEEGDAVEATGQDAKTSDNEDGTAQK